MGSIKEFLFTIPKCFYPDSYKELSYRSMRQTMKYFFGILTLCFVIMCAIYVPVMMALPNNLAGEMDKFTKLYIRVNESMKEPIVLPEDRPFITIDTTGKYTSLDEGNVLITEDAIEYKPWLTTQKIQTDGDVNMLDHKDKIVSLVVLILMLIVPSLLIYWYLTFAIKFLIIIFVSGVIAWLIGLAAKNRMTPLRAFKVSIFASTAMIMTEIISRPFGIGKWLLDIPLPFGLTLSIVPIALFLIFLIIGMAIAGHKEVSLKKRGEFESY